MKKKIFLPSIGLMALLAACSNDELFENKPISVDNNGRPTVNLVLGAELPEMDEASTRVVGGTEDKGNGKWGFDWYWETNDVLGAGLFEDYATGNVTNGEYQTNYAFLRTDENGNKVKGATFGAKSPVTVGSYVFYRPYNPSSARAKIGHTLTENGRIQKLQCGEKGMEELGNNNNFFFSPLYKVDIPFDEDKFQAEATKLPVKFASAYSYLRIILGGEFQDASTGSYWGKMKISKVELSPLEAGKEFVTSFTVNPRDVAAIQYDWAIENDRLANVDKDHGTLMHDVQGVEECAEEIVKALKKDSYTLKNSFRINGEDYSKDDVIYLLNETTPAQTAKKLIYELDGDGFTYNKEGDEFVLYIPVPSGTYAKGSYDYKLNGASQKGEGVFMLEVYTSEGKATFILGKELETVTFNRDSPNRFSDKLYIKADESNIDFYAYNESGIDVATEAEWKYALDFIEGHSQIFNNKTPRINLNGDIKVNSLPEYKLQIVGEKTITLEGGAFKLNPEKTFLGEEGKNVPTLEVAKNSTLNFEKDIKTLKLINNGTVNANQNVTMQSMTSYEGAELNISEGKNVIVNANTTNASAYNVNLGAKATLTVNAENAAINGTMTAENGAAVTLNGTTANATNNVTLKPASTLNVKGGVYTTSGALDIQADGEKVSTVNITSNTVNTGDITVSGKLTAKTLNNKGDFIVEAAQGKGRDLSGAVVLTLLINDGTVATKAGAEVKNTYGGTIDVDVLTNNNVINNNGELVVSQRGSNKAVTGTINLQSDKYALIVLPGNNFVNNGKIVIDEPKNYNIYEYYKNWNHLENLNGNGTIEATLTSQDQYDQVLKQQKDYSAANKYTAWDVINKFYVDCNLKLTKVTSDRDAELKDVVLKANRELTVVDGLVVNSFTTEGANSVLKTDATKTVTFTVQTANVAKNSSVTIAEKVKLLIRYQALAGTNYMLNVAGELTNKGQIDTEDGTTTKGHQISAYIASTGKLINEGSLSKKSEAKYDLAAYSVLANMISKLYTPGQNNGSDYRGVHHSDNSMRVDLIECSVANLHTNGEWNIPTTWDSYTSASADNAITAERLKYILKNGVLTTVKGYQVIAAKHQNATYANSWSYAIYLGGSNTGNTEVISSKVFAEIQKIVKDGSFKIANGKPSDMPYLYKTWFVVEELCGTLNLSKGEAWGEVKKVNGGTLINDFTNRL